MLEQARQLIEDAWNDRTRLKQSEVQSAIRSIIEALDKGQIRVATPSVNGNWTVNDWGQKSGNTLFSNMSNGNNRSRTL